MVCLLNVMLFRFVVFSAFASDYLEIFLLVGVVALSQLFLICFFIDVAFRLL